MILADTSIWADHIRGGSPILAEFLDGEEVVMHSFVIAELALGNLQKRTSRIASLSRLPQVVEASHEEAMHLLESLQLWGRGIGYVDLHLLASARLSEETVLWSRDRRLAACADLIGVGFSLSGSA